MNLLWSKENVEKFMNGSAERVMWSNVSLIMSSVLKMNIRKMDFDEISQVLSACVQFNKKQAETNPKFKEHIVTDLCKNLVSLGNYLINIIGAFLDNENVGGIISKEVMSIYNDVILPSENKNILQSLLINIIVNIYLEKKNEKTASFLKIAHEIFVFVFAK